MFSSIFIVLFALFAIVIAHNKEFVHRRYRQLPRLLTKGETDLVHLRIGLKHDSESIQKLKTIADHVSDPTHPNYGKYLNVEEIKSILHSKERESTVISWLKSALGVKQVKTVLTGDWLEVVAPAARVEQAFSVELRWFEHNSSKRRVLKTLDDIQLPSHVTDHIEIVVGLTDFFDSKTERKASMMSDVDVNAIKDTSPEILPTRGSENRLEVTVKPYDSNGDPFRHMAPNDELRVTVLSNYGEYHQRSFKLQDDSCELTADGLMCGLQFVMNTAFSRVNITAQTAFNHGSTSPISSYFINGTMAAWVDPSVAYQTYKVPHGEYNTFKHNSQAVVAFEQQYVSMVDLEMFHDLNGLPFNRSLVHIHGPNDPTKPGGESTLDLQWIMATGRNVETHFLSFCGPGPAKGPCGAYILDWAIFVANSTRPPLVTSISYGDTEQGYFNKFGSWSYFDRMENELMKMAVRGLTVFAGSGDAGATNVGEAGNDISPTDPTCGVVRPFFPSDSHYVVSLSASLLTTQTTKFCNSAQTYEPYHRKTGIQCSRVGEKSVSLTYGGTYWTTGGGFSHRLGRPSFQHAAVEAYLQQAQGQLPANFNRNGRAYADLTALGFNLNVVLNRVTTPIGGTSASGPLMAGIFSLLNGRQLQRRGTSLGNPLPWIYTTLANTPGAFNDLTYGRNDDGDFQKRGSPYPSFCPGSGYPLTTGFDAVSGWGSINYDVVVANLP